jgi:hypothetical protein
MASLQLAITQNRMDCTWPLTFCHSWLGGQPDYGMVVLRTYLCSKAGKRPPPSPPNHHRATPSCAFLEQEPEGGRTGSGPASCSRGRN